MGLTTGRPTIRRLTALTTALTVAILGLAAPAAASHVSCGDVITTDTTLDSDVGPCTSDGLIIEADGITLDLNGHRIFGLEDLPGEGVGVRIVGRTGVHVTNGVISDFDAGVALLDGANQNKVSGITARDNVGTAFGDFGDGIAISQSHDNLILKNTVVRNGPFDGIGMFNGSSGNTINQNFVADNDIASSPTVNQDDGIRMEPNTTNNTVVNNTVLRNGLDGIAVFFQSTGNVIENNTVRDNGFHDKLHRKGDGIRVFSEGNNTLIKSNSVFDNAANGIRVDSLNNDILDNKTGGNGVEIENAFDLHDSNENCDNNTWSNNTFDTANPPCTTG